MTKSNAKSLTSLVGGPLKAGSLSFHPPKKGKSLPFPTPSSSGTESTSPVPTASGLAKLDDLFGQGPSPALKHNIKKLKMKQDKTKAALVKAMKPPVVAPVLEQKEEEIPPAVELLVIYRDPSGRCHGALNSKGHMVCDRGNHNWYDSFDGSSYPNVVYSDAMTATIEGSQKSLGHYLVGGKDAKTITLKSSIIHVNQPSYKIGDTCYPQSDSLVALPIVERLESRFPNPHLSVSNLNAFLAVVVRDFGTVNAYLLKSSLDFFVSRVYCRRQLLLTQENLHRIEETAKSLGPETRTYVPPSTLDAQEYLLSLGQPIEHGTFYRNYAESPLREPDLSDNGNFSIVDSRGYTPYNKGKIAGYFLTATNAFPKLYRTVFCRLTGEKDFRVLDSDGRQTGYAMSRLYKAREGDATLRANQQAILNSLQIEEDILVHCSNRPVPDILDDIKSQVDIDNSEAAQDTRRALGDFFSNNTVKHWPIFQLMATFFLLPLYLMCAFTSKLHWLQGFMLNLASAVYHRKSWYAKRPVKAKLYLTWFWQRHRLYGHSDTGFFKQEPVEAKFKNEIAKPDKVGRLYVTYGSSIINAGWIYSSVKSLFCRTYDLTDLVQENSTTERTRLTIQVVKSLDEGYSPDTDTPGLHARLFSDDMTCTYMSATGETIEFDADISSCDAGNSYAMFYLLGTVLKRSGFGEYIKRQFARLREDITVYNPCTRSGKREYVKLRPKTIFQGSGCPETTMVNNCASMCIIVAFSTFIDHSNENGMIVQDESGADITVHFDSTTPHYREVILQKAAAAVGHVITINWCETKADTQFLKHSLLSDEEGELVNTRNFGAIFRGLGSLDGDVTAKSLGLTKGEFKSLSMGEKMELYISGVVGGLCNEPSNIIMDALRQRFKRKSPKIFLSYAAENAQSHDRSQHYLPTSSLAARYGGTESEWEELATAIGNLRLGTVIPSRLLTDIYRIDYALK